MTPDELRIAQIKLCEEITLHAEQKSLTIKDELEPIYDGVADTEAYLLSSPKIMWILKEPYDEIESGNPYGGGWSIVDDCIAKIEEKPVSRTWYNIIYVMQGVRNGLHWDEIDDVSENHSIANILKEIAYINVSKMPNQTVTSNSALRNFYEIWREILWKQINLYNPDIIIFGNTFHLFKSDFNINGDLIEAANNGVWSWKNKLLLAAYHPQRKGKEYVNNIIDIINKYYRSEEK